MEIVFQALCELTADDLAVVANANQDDAAIGIRERTTLSVTAARPAPFLRSTNLLSAGKAVAKAEAVMEAGFEAELSGWKGGYAKLVGL